MRYALTLSYKGTAYEGWQSQPGKITVQSTLENAIKTICREAVEIVGCGRTDSGVHAKYYVAHFDLSHELPKDFVYHLNAILPADIAIQETKIVQDDFHARYDAMSRTYEYYIHGYKSPFIDQSSYRLKKFEYLSVRYLQESADILLLYHSFFPFCLSNSGVENYNVQLIKAKWEETELQKLKFTIQANRFLRGMVRLVVGMCINVACGQITKEDVINALNDQKPLIKSLSVPAHGLYLTAVDYGDKLT